MLQPLRQARWRYTGGDFRREVARAIARVSIIAVLVVVAAVVWQEPEGVEATGVVAIDAGGLHTCLLNTAGGIECWGYNDYGQLGNGAENFGQPSPTSVIGLTTGVAGISAGGRHTCAVTDSGGVKCWGHNSSGQLGNGSTTDSNVPVDVTGLSSGMVSVSAGGWHTCAVTESSTVKCWGYNYFGQLGNATTAGPDLCGPYACSPTPVDVCADAACSSPLSDVVEVSVGELDTCAVTGAGAAKCWGYNNAAKLGNGTATDSSIPVDVTGLQSGVTGISAGDHHTCALMTNGTLKCWGYSPEGKLGNGTGPGPDNCYVVLTACFDTPIDVTSLSNVSAISSGFSHTCGIAAQALRCWGYNDYGQLGDGTLTTSGLPLDVTGLETNPTSVTSGERHSCALSANGAVQCWGSNYAGMLGHGSMTLTGCLCVARPVYVNGHGPKGDLDADGCPSNREEVSGPGSEMQGGSRDSADPWDYFNPTRDKQNRVDDILAVVGQYFVDSGDVNYTPSTDRTWVGPNAWNTGPPNGLQRVDDILNAIHQYFHDCV